jgi:transcriptional regulator with XRE-family HTH domain
MKNKRKLKQFGKFLRQQRDDHRYTIRAFAKKSGITTGTLFRIEEGTAEAGMCALEGIAKALKMANAAEVLTKFYVSQSKKEPVCNLVTPSSN